MNDLRQTNGRRDTDRDRIPAQTVLAISARIDALNQDNARILAQLAANLETS